MITRLTARILGFSLWPVSALLTGVAFADPEPSPIYRLKSGRFLARDELDFGKLQAQSEGRAFCAVRTNQWPPGMVPIFQIERTNRVELRRRPLRGQTSYTEPLFFGFPPEGDAEAVKLAGHWESIAERPGGTKDYPALELAVEGEQVSGRFDQNTEYRYADVWGGTFRTNRLELRIDYMNESWFLEGVWSEGKIAGTWRRSDNAEKGRWEATRNTPVLPRGDLMDLYEWRRAEDRFYGITNPGVGWTRADRPLCRVWQPECVRER